MNFTIGGKKNLRGRKKVVVVFFKVSCGFNLIKGFVATVQSLVLKFKILKKKSFSGDPIIIILILIL